MIRNDLDTSVEKGSLMAGQSVSLVERSMPVRAIIGTVLKDIETELQSVSDLFKTREK